MVMTSDLKETLHRLPHTLRVGAVPGGLCEYLSIQAAINYAAAFATAANPWTIYIYPGIYNEVVTCASWVNLRGIGPRGSVVIQQTDARVIILVDNVQLQNLTVRLVTPTGARQLVYDNAAACTALLEDINFEITTPGGFNHALMRFYGAGHYTVRGCFANIGAAGATFYTIEHDQNAGMLHLFNNDFTAATGYHIRSGVACVITGGQNRWAGACHMFNVIDGTITLDKDAVVCTGSVSGDVVGGAVVCRNGENSFEVYEGMMIQHALTACAAGGEVFIHAGTYAPIANLTVAANTLVRGEGKASIITPTGAAITRGFNITGGNVTLKDMKIILAAGAGAGGTRPNVIYAFNVPLLWLENLWIVGDTSVGDDGAQERQNGIYFSAVTHSKILNCRSTTNRRYGIQLYNTSNFNTVAGNTCLGNLSHGIYVSTNSTNNTIMGNTCQGNTGVGIYVDVSSVDNSITGNPCQGNGNGIVLAGSAIRNTVAGNTCQGNTTAGISINSTDNSIAGNTCQGNDNGITVNASRNALGVNNCRGNTTHGIYIYQASYCAVTGNTCTGQTNGDGINVEGDGAGNADYNSLTGNTCTGNGDDGIAIEGGVDANKNIVLGNQLLGNTGTPLVDNGTNTEIGHNITV